MLIDFDPVSVMLALGAGLLFLAVYFFFWNRWLAGRRAKALETTQIDSMDGPAFEAFVASLLTRRGFKVKQTGKSGDLGVDLIAERGRNKYAVQVKRQSQPVSRHAVSDAVGGQAHYRCNGAMVVTNNYFSAGAQQLARANKCILIDRRILAEWIVEAND